MDAKKLLLKPEFEKAFMDLGFSELTEIQEKCIPLIQQGKDVIGLSYTGSGKTVAFGFPALEKVNPGKGAQLLVIAPTRELSNQIAKEFRKFVKYMPMHIIEIYGGVSIIPQIEKLKRAEVVVGTPGRLLDHLSRGTFSTNNIKMLILDEADKMFDMGFIFDIRKIISRIPKNCQKLMFGATMPPQIMRIAKDYMNNPERIRAQEYVDESKMAQYYYDAPRDDKFSLLTHLIKKETKGLVIVFCGTRIYVDIIDKNLKKQGIDSQALHGGLSQNRRDQVMEAFHARKFDVLVASDIAARGLDIKNVNMIINYDLPRTSDDYVHRIGRTARAGCSGKVVSLLSREDHDNFKRILQDRSLLIEKLKTPLFERLEFVQRQRYDNDMPQRRGYGRPNRQGFGRPRSRRF